MSSSFGRADLTGSSFENCSIEGTQINCFLLSDLIKVYEQSASKR